MDKLDLDLLSKILNLLPLKDKIRNREVSKRFQFAIDNQNSKSLVIIRKNKFWIRRTWFDNFKLVDYSNLIIFKKNNRTLFESNFFKNRFFVNLKRLLIDYGNCEYKDKIIQIEHLNFLANFEELEILNIDFSIHQLKQTNQLTLKNLKCLRVNLIRSNYDLIFNTPNLEFLSANNLKNLKFLNPSIKHLRLDSDINQNYVFIKEFNHLQYLDYNSFKIEDYVSLKNLIECQTSNLKELCIISYQTVNLDELKDCSQRNAIQVYINGLSIDCWYKFSSGEQKVLERYNLNIYLENYLSTHSLLTSIIDINYSAWESEWINHRIPDDFLSKLVNISSIYVNRRVLRTDYFIQFLLNFEMIHSLKLCDSTLGQQFYSKINLYIPFVRFLMIQDEQNLSKQLDFTFLFKLKYLERIFINYQLSLELIRDLFLKLSNLKEIEVLYNDQFLIISRYVKNSTRFKATDNDHLKRFAIDLTNEYNKDVCFAIGHFIENLST